MSFRFINYGSGSKRFPLQDVLLYALEFARSKPEHSSKQSAVSQDVEMTSPSPTARLVIVLIFELLNLIQVYLVVYESGSAVAQKEA